MKFKWILTIPHPNNLICVLNSVSLHLSKLIDFLPLHNILHTSEASPNAVLATNERMVQIIDVFSSKIIISLFPVDIFHT